MAALNAHPFTAPSWLRNAHAQTMWAPMFRRAPIVSRRIDRIDTPDGDFVVLYISEGERDKPAVLLLHGLEGSANSKYILGMHQKLQAIGWHCITMEFRGCSGEMNRARRLYHSGETTDLEFVTARLVKQFPRLYLAGFSLGGNVLAKWLGESAACVPANVRAAAVVSVPFDLVVSGPHIDRVLRGFYAKHFLRSLVKKAIVKEKQFPNCVNVAKLRKARTLYDFDNHATAALHGFRDVDHYYSSQRSGQFLGQIRVPTMLLSAADDPFNPASTLPREVAAHSEYLHPQFTEHGGHVGFVCGAPHHARYWAEEQLVRFLQIYERIDHEGV